jgi:hypothetical protein
MSITKLLSSTLLVLAVLFAQVGVAAAAPQTQDTTPITGTIQSITTETDANGVTTVLVALLDDQGTTQTVRLSVDTAVSLGLVTLDATTQEPVVDETQVGQPVEIDPTTVIPDEEPAQESVHPIAWLLAEFFGEDPNVVEGYHEDGFGFGVIAQSLWISQNVGGDASLAGQILQAKQSGDYSAITLSDGTPLTLPDGSVPTNWGQFKKALLDKKNNLGIIVSGHADQDDSTDSLLTQQQHGNGKDNENKGKGKDKNKNHP